MYSIPCHTREAKVYDAQKNITFAISNIHYVIRFEIAVIKIQSIAEKFKHVCNEGDCLGNKDVIFFLCGAIIKLVELVVERFHSY